MFTEIIDDFTDLKTKILLKITKDDNSEPRFQWFENCAKCRISCASYFGGLRNSDVRNSEKFWAPSAPNFLHFLTKLSNNSSGNSLVSNIRNICFLISQLSFQLVVSVCERFICVQTRICRIYPTSVLRFENWEWPKNTYFFENYGDRWFHWFAFRSFLGADDFSEQW